MAKIPSILTIAGSDSSGGAGLQADCAVARFLGVFPFCAVTAVTSQGISGLRKVQITDADIFRDQLEVAFEEYQPDAVKIGLLPSVLKDILIQVLKYYSPPNVVIDPVKAPSLIEEGADKVKFGWSKNDLSEIKDIVNVFTPNIPEALVLLENEEYSVNGKDIELHEKLINILPQTLQIQNILIKGGHNPMEGQITDRLVISLSQDTSEKRIISFSHPEIETRNTHGTGCALSSAIACYLALGDDVEEAVRKAILLLKRSMTRIGKLKFFNDERTHGPAFFLF